MANCGGKLVGNWHHHPKAEGSSPVVAVETKGQCYKTIPR
jgi:hypothetical protein